jgi:hypothetical protein
MSRYGNLSPCLMYLRMMDARTAAEKLAFQ